LARTTSNPPRPPFRRPSGLWHRLQRVVRFRLIVPIQRSRHSPEHTARGVMMGLIVACLPVPAGQMAIAFAVWVIARRLFKWDFSVIQGVAWTWVTNIFTSPPIYYGFFVTGQILLGRWHDLGGYDSFARTFTTALSGELGALETLRALGRLVVLEWGLAMWLGAVPWAALSGWLGYRLALRFVVAHRHARARRMEMRLARSGRPAS
jgi:uncharacterized protein (DUF2062 family)